MWSTLLILSLKVIIPLKIKLVKCSTLIWFACMCNICKDIQCGKTIHHFKVRNCEHLGDDDDDDDDDDDKLF